MPNITFLFFAYNEEKRIEAVVKNCAPYGKVLILDGGSTDRTEELARKNGAQFVLRPETKEQIAENQEMYDFIKKNVNTEWVFWGFCDNIMPNTLLEKLVEISKQDKIKYVVIPLHTYLWGETRHPMEKKADSPRFFMKDYMDFTGNHIHGMGTFLGKKEEVLTLPRKDKYALLHFSLYDLSKFVPSHLNYAQLEAVDRFNSGRKFSFFRMILSMARYFFIYYRNGYKNGMTGFISAMSYSYFRFMMFVRLYELEHGITLESIGGNYAEEIKNVMKKK